MRITVTFTITPAVGDGAIDGVVTDVIYRTFAHPVNCTVCVMDFVIDCVMDCASKCAMDSTIDCISNCLRDCASDCHVGQISAIWAPHLAPRDGLFSPSLFRSYFGNGLCARGFSSQGRTMAKLGGWRATSIGQVPCHPPLVGRIPLWVVKLNAQTDLSAVSMMPTRQIGSSSRNIS